MTDNYKKEMNDKYNVLESVVRDTYISVVWSHKIQEKQSDIYAELFKIMGFINIVAASITSVGITAIIFTDPLWLKAISAVISFATICTTLYIKYFDLEKRSTSHKVTANKLNAVRDQYKVLLTQIRLQNDSVENLFLKYKKLLRKTLAIYRDAPSTTDKAVNRAREALIIMKDNTFLDEEIDSCLPVSLRRKTND